MSERKYRNFKSFNSNYIGGWTFADGDKVFTIKDVHEQNVRSEKNQSGEEKMCIYFEETDKPMILNSTNNDTIAAVIGSPNFDDWIGKKILIGTEKVKAFGDIWDAVRVRLEKPTTKPNGKPITEEHIEKVRQLCEAGIVNEDAMLKYYKVESIEGLTDSQAKQLIDAKGGKE